MIHKAVPSEKMFQGKSGMKTMYVSPDLAKKWLATQKRNRTIGTARISYLSRVMSSGDWTQTGEPIKFDKDGHLLDGQGRLHAVIDCGKTIEFDVRFGLSPKAQLHMDGGWARTKANNLQMTSVSYASIVSAICDNIARWESGHFWASYYKITKGENQRMFNRDPNGFVHSATVASAVRPLLYPAISGTMHYLFSGIGKDAADFFFRRLIDGAGLVENHPILILRNRCIKLSQQKKGRQWGNDVGIQFGMRHQQLLLLISAWNAYREGRTPSKLQLPTSGQLAINGLAEREILQLANNGPADIQLK